MLEDALGADLEQERPFVNVAVWSYPRTVDTLPGDFIASNGSGAS
jgi:hypothetical protein